MKFKMTTEIESTHPYIGSCERTDDMVRHVDMYSYETESFETFKNIAKDAFDVLDYEDTDENIKKYFGIDNSFNIQKEKMEQIRKYYRKRKELFEKCISFVEKNMNASENGADVVSETYSIPEDYDWFVVTDDEAPFEEKMKKHNFTVSVIN